MHPKKVLAEKWIFSKNFFYNCFITKVPVSWNFWNQHKISDFLHPYRYCPIWEKNIGPYFGMVFLFFWTLQLFKFFKVAFNADDLKGQSHEKVGEMGAQGDSLGPN
jgi:hypothetical protein